MRKYKKPIAAVLVVFLSLFVLAPARPVEANPAIVITAGVGLGVLSTMIAAGACFTNTDDATKAVNNYWNSSSTDMKSKWEVIASSLAIVAGSTAYNVTDELWNDMRSYAKEKYNSGANAVNVVEEAPSEYMVDSTQYQAVDVGSDCFSVQGQNIAKPGSPGYYYRGIFKNGVAVCTETNTSATALQYDYSVVRVDMVLRARVVTHGTQNVIDYRVLANLATVPVTARLAPVSYSYNATGAPWVDETTEEADWDTIDELLYDWYYDAVSGEWQKQARISTGGPNPDDPDPPGKGRLIQIGPTLLSDISNMDAEKLRLGKGKVTEKDPTKPYEPAADPSPVTPPSMGTTTEKTPQPSTRTTTTVEEAPKEGGGSTRTTTQVAETTTPVKNEDGTTTTTKTTTTTITKQDYDPQGNPEGSPTIETKPGPTSSTTENPTSEKTELTTGLIDILTDTEVNPADGKRYPTKLDFGPLLIAGAKLTWKFPFSLPWDLARAFSPFANAGEWQPKFDVVVPDTAILKGFSWTADLTMFNGLASVARKFELLIFSVGLIMATRKLMGGDV